MLYVLPMRVFFVLIFLFPVVYFTQSRSLINFTDEDGLKQGDWKVRYENSQFTRYTGHFKDGTPIGEFKYYYPNGLLSAIVNFSGSTANATMYHENGRVLSVGKYTNQLKDSVWYFFNDRNELLNSEDYVEGKIHGKQFIYYPVDPSIEGIKIMEMYNFNEGVKHGFWEHYFENGHIKAKGKFKNGYQNGEVFYYFSNGQVDLKGWYKNGKKTGIWTYYANDGSVKEKVYYKNDNLLKGKELELYLQQIERKKENLKRE